MSTKEEADGLRTQSAQEMQFSEHEFTAAARHFGKWFCLWRFNHNYLSRRGCEAEFASHPEWMDA
jgi:hypothetical protein